jgi:hypothetical protein
MIDRRKSSRAVKLRALLVVVILFAFGKVLGKHWPDVDTFVHYSIAGFLLLRVPFRKL